MFCDLEAALIEGRLREPVRRAYERESDPERRGLLAIVLGADPDAREILLRDLRGSRGGDQAILRVGAVYGLAGRVPATRQHASDRLNETAWSERLEAWDRIRGEWARRDFDPVGVGLSDYYPTLGGYRRRLPESAELELIERLEDDEHNVAETAQLALESGSTLHGRRRLVEWGAHSHDRLSTVLRIVARRGLEDLSMVTLFDACHRAGWTENLIVGISEALAPQESPIADTLLEALVELAEERGVLSWIEDALRFRIVRGILRERVAAQPEIRSEIEAELAKLRRRWGPQ
jgi:hypothetical protein